MHLFEELHDAVKKFGFKSNIVEDSFNNSISNLGLVYKSILLSILYKKKLEKEKTVAIMMPNTVVTSVLFFVYLIIIYFGYKSWTKIKYEMND